MRNSTLIQIDLALFCPAKANGHLTTKAVELD